MHFVFCSCHFFVIGEQQNLSFVLIKKIKMLRILLLFESVIQAIVEASWQADSHIRMYFVWSLTEICYIT